MADSGHQIGEDNRECWAVVHPDIGILPWASGPTPGYAKGAYVDKKDAPYSEEKWIELVEAGFRVQRISCVPISKPRKAIVGLKEPA